MKQLLIIVFSSLIFFDLQDWAAGSLNEDVPPADVESCLDKASVTDPDALQATPACAKKLREYMEQHWQDVVQSWNKVATTDKRQWLFLNLGESLSPQKYMDFLDAALQLRQGGKISEKMFQAEVLMPEGEKKGFLAVNYREPRVRDYIKSIRNISPQSLWQFLDNLLSGESATSLQDEYSADNRQISPDLLLSSGK